ncbi:SET3 histone deacetylase complex ankyrin repeat protein [Phytophthora megakarya]|uniref:SET3 histone deacetylase complex ankyrin repeat protein n=1 Tax=Phytophthora megakarya TaxID=4795 RepID=A0A225WLH5_9STRA|nr:SET3 histone deacetylase complex ankyrin repeat protein [Phytophthora megakarya]
MATQGGDDNEETNVLHVSLKELPDAMDTAVYVMEKFPLIVDPSGQATRFLKYQRGTMLMVANPTDMAPESLRRHLVGALKHGSLLIINFDTLTTLELEQFFAPESFPCEVYSRQQLFSPEVFGKLLRPREGDSDVAGFIINDHFKLVVLCRAEMPPPATAKEMCAIHVLLPSEGGKAGTDTADFAKLLGVAKETKRNSTELVEAAFDDDMDTVVACLDKNYDIESEDGHGHTALSEAACQGHKEIVSLLLERGADPNKCNDENRSPLYRAAYNGHLETIQLMLESGGDPRLRSKQGETAFDVAKNAEAQALLAQWDLSKTDRLVDERRKMIEAKWQERITNHVEREQFAVMQIHSELLEIAREGKVEELEKRLEQLADEALETGERPRACADIRDEKGSTLLALAAQFDHMEMVILLVSKGKALEVQAREMTVNSTSTAQKEAAARTSMLARVWKVNVNSRDCRGWAPVAIAVFHEAKKCLRVLLDNGADPNLKNQYNKNAYYFAKDDLDAANNIVKSKAEIRQVLIDWENEHRPAPHDLDAANNIVKSKAEIRQVLIDWENEHRPASVVPTSTSQSSPSKTGKSGKKPAKSIKKAGSTESTTTCTSKVSKTSSTKTKALKTKKPVSEVCLCKYVQKAEHDQHPQYQRLGVRPQRVASALESLLAADLDNLLPVCKFSILHQGIHIPFDINLAAQQGQ